jgi:hypothetical protein
MMSQALEARIIRCVHHRHRLERARRQDHRKADDVGASVQRVVDLPEHAERTWGRPRVEANNLRSIA